MPWRLHGSMTQRGNTLGRHATVPPVSQDIVARSAIQHIIVTDDTAVRELDRVHERIGERTGKGVRPPKIRGDHITVSIDHVIARAAHQHIVIDATRQEIPVRPRADGAAEASMCPRSGRAHSC